MDYEPVAAAPAPAPAPVMYEEAEAAPVWPWPVTVYENNDSRMYESASSQPIPIYMRQGSRAADFAAANESPRSRNSRKSGSSKKSSPRSRSQK